VQREPKRLPYVPHREPEIRRYYRYYKLVCGPVDGAGTSS
jgi:hypothetical protein